MAKNVEYINDIKGFSIASIYPELAKAKAKLIVMHSMQEVGIADQVNRCLKEVEDSINSFFEKRIEELTKAGISADRLIIDPGMGMFLSSDHEVSFSVLKSIEGLKKRFGLPVLISTSRKSFIRGFLGCDIEESGAGSLIADIYAMLHQVDYIRTHDTINLLNSYKMYKKLFF